MGDCTRCHAPIAVGSYSQEQWDAILPRMAKSARLDRIEADDLQTYIQAVLRDASPRSG